jgi:hypothetical protein
MNYLYRATRDVLDVGTQLPPRLKRPYEDFDQPELERVLEAACPDCRFSRLRAYFAFEQIAWAAGFYVTQGRSAAVTEKHRGKMSVYALEAEEARSVAYALVYQISLMLQSGQGQVAEVLAQEYWQAGDTWGFREILVPAARVVGIEVVQGATEPLVEEAKRKLEPDRLRARERVIAAGGTLVSPVLFR